MEYVSAIQLISLFPVPMSGAGTSTPGPFLGKLDCKATGNLLQLIHLATNMKGMGGLYCLCMCVCSIGPVDSHMLYAIRIHVRLHHSNSIITYIHSTNPNDSTHLYVYKTLWKPCNTYVRTCSRKDQTLFLTHSQLKTTQEMLLRVAAHWQQCFLKHKVLRRSPQ